MKLRGIFALFAICVIVKGAWWAAATQPVIMSLGAVLTATNSDVLDVHSFDWREIYENLKKWIGIPSGNKEEEKSSPISERLNEIYNDDRF